MSHKIEILLNIKVIAFKNKKMWVIRNIKNIEDYNCPCLIIDL